MSPVVAPAKMPMYSLCVTLVLVHFRPHGVSGAQSVPGLGVNWGALASHLIDPRVVANLLKDNGINKVKIFDSDSWTLNALAGTNMEVMIGIPNDQLKRFAKSEDDAKKWVKKNVTKHLHDGGVNIRYVAVGNEPLLKSYNGSFVWSTFPAMQNIQRALEKAGLGDKVKVTTPLNADVYESTSNKPSDGQFRDDIRDLMWQIVHFLDEKKSAFVVNIYPYLSLYENEGFPLDFAFFDNNGRTIQDNNVQYTNVFDANFDTLVSSLKKLGVPNLKIIVGEVGWPTDGAKNANPENAKRFYQGLMKNMANQKGTPLHPSPVDIYLFSLFDEDAKSIAPGAFERHWGVFTYDGKPKFPVDFTGHGEDKMPVGAKGVKYQLPQWCVLDKDIKNLSEVQPAINYACGTADCTSLGFYSSCSNLDLAGNASYAFNQFFQLNDQSVEACKFNGLATIVKEDPSRGTCLFQIALEINGGGRLKAAGLLIGFVLMFLTFA